MRFSLYLNPQTSGPDQDHRIIEDITASALRADAAGFAGVCLTQHHFSDYNTYSDPFMYGSYLAGQMKRAWVMLTVAVAPLMNPMNLVERINLLDQLLSGRLIVAVGSGGSSLEFEGLGRDPDDKAKVTAEVMEAANQAWKHSREQGPLEYRTTHDHGVMRGRIMPGPFTQGGPRIAKTGLSPASWDLAGEAAQPLVFGRVGPDGAKNVMDAYHAALIRSGHDSQTVEFCMDWSLMQKTVLLADTDSEANIALDEPLTNLQRMSTAAFTQKQYAQSTGIKADIKTGDGFRQAFIEGATIVGSPETVVQRLQEYEAAGVRHVALHMNFGLMDNSVAERSLELFISKVMPNFAQTPEIAAFA